MDAFPNTWYEFWITYTFFAEDYNLTMDNLAGKHIDALGEKMTLIEDSVYCNKLVTVAIGGKYEADAPNYLKMLLHKVMWEKTDAMLNELSKVRKGYRMQFWQFFWSNEVTSKNMEEEFQRLFKLKSESHPEEMKIMEIAFNYFYNGVNIVDGAYSEE